MSFSSQIKNEILNNKDINRHCAIAELSGMLQNNFTIVNGSNIKICFSSENQYFSKRFMELSIKYFNTPIEIKVRKNRNIRQNYTFFGIIKNAYELLRAIEVIDEKFIFRSKTSYANQMFIKRNCCKGAYLRGEFIVAGSISDPSKNYHLEFIKSNMEDGKALCQTLNEYELNAKITKRKGYYVVYIKEGDKVSDFLNIIGVHQSLLYLESLMVEKDVKNIINRRQNCEMANLNKTITAALKHISDIEFIEKKRGLSYLDEELREIAILRTQDTDLTLVEIGRLLNPPISKSSVNYRLKKISNIAENLRRD